MITDLKDKLNKEILIKLGDIVFYTHYISGSHRKIQHVGISLETKKIKISDKDDLINLNKRDNYLKVIHVTESFGIKEDYWGIMHPIPMLKRFTNKKFKKIFGDENLDKIKNILDSSNNLEFWI